LSDRKKSSYGPAWLAVCLSLALHVLDEALNGFLSVYNPAANAIRLRIPFLPLPVFTFGTWLRNLIIAIILLLLLTPFTYRKSRWMAIIAYGFAILMTVNGLAHIAGSVYLGRLMPGVYSSPILVASSVFLFIKVRKLGESMANHV